MFGPTAATVQPALLATGLRRVALERGVRIHEHTPMTSWAEGPGVTVQTPGGTVQAEKLVLATNAWMVREPQVARMLVVVTSDMVVTRPIPEMLDHTGPRGGLAVYDSRMLVNYYRTTVDQRLAFGHGGGDFGFGRRVGAGFNGHSGPRHRDPGCPARGVPSPSVRSRRRLWIGSHHRWLRQAAL